IPTLHGAFVQYKFINQDEIELRYEDFNLILDKLQVQDIISTKIIRENQSIVLEDLSVKNMMQSKKLAKGISEVSWYQFRLMIEYKAKWYGREVIIADKHFASSLYQ
ncbi:MAG: IS200/IS605 family accessory protein TnpB-related protein, partial [Synergistaceae bacterium]